MSHFMPAWPKHAPCWHELQLIIAFCRRGAGDFSHAFIVLMQNGAAISTIDDYFVAARAFTVSWSFLLRY